MLRIPEHAWNCIGIGMEGKVAIAPLFGDAQANEMPVRQTVDSGIQMSLQKMSGVVLKVRKKQD